MLILGIETSCDETSAAVVENGHIVRSNVIASSQMAFQRSGGVIPEQAARRQVECILPVIEQALDDAHCSWVDIDVIAVTRGPGLLGSLLVGTTTARVLAWAFGKPLIGVHHTLGHLSSTWLEPIAPPSNHLSIQPSFPLITLSVSGGHSDLWLRESHTRGTLLGRTRDDAAGEAFDKGASLLGLPYPGGPAIAALAEGGDPHAFPFPLPLKDEDTLDFSFSGLKTSFKYLLRDLGTRNPPFDAAQGRQLVTRNLASSYQNAICRHLITRLAAALEAFPDVKEVHIVGGVSANIALRCMAGALCEEHKRILRTPATLSYCTDNAAMIAAAGEFTVRETGKEASVPFETMASLTIDLATPATTRRG